MALKSSNQESSAIEDCTALSAFMKGQCSGSLKMFTENYFPHHASIKSAPYHTKEFKQQEKLNTRMRYIRAEPRDHGKTTRLMILMLWAILYQKKRFIIIVSDTDEQAKQIYSNVKNELEENEKIIQDFGDLMAGASINTAHKALLTNGVMIECLGSGRKLRGLKFKQYRPDLIILDDVENDRSVRSKQQRKHLYDWFLKVILPMMDKQRGDLFVVGTLLHQQSLLNKILTEPQFTKWNRKVYSAVSDKGKILWRAKFNKKLLREIELEIGTRAFNSEYLNNPVDSENTIFDMDWLKFYEPGGEPSDASVVMAIDPAISKKDKADYFAVATLARCNVTKKFYLLSMVRTRDKIKNLINLVFSLARQYQPDKLLVETVAFQETLKQLLEEECKTRGMPLPILSVKNHSDKIMRISKLQPVFQRGDVFVNERMDEFITEYALYPNSEHDDQLDALEMAFSGFARQEIQFA